MYSLESFDYKKAETASVLQFKPQLPCVCKDCTLSAEK